MLKFLLLIPLVIIFLGLLFGFSALLLLFSPRRRQKQSNKSNQSNPNNKQQQTQHQSTPASKKIIDSDEGEYIDYEEVKD